MIVSKQRKNILYFLFTTFAFILIFSFQKPVFAETIYTVSTPEQYRDLIIQKMIKRETPIKINYIGDKPLVGPNDYFKIVPNYMEKNPSLNYYYNTTNYSASYGYDTATQKLLINWDFYYLTTNEQETYVQQKADSILKSIITTGMTEEQKYRAIVKYMYDNVDYDYNYQNISYTSYGAARYGSAVCEGYTSFTQLLFTKVGIQSLMVEGYVRNSEAHTWNIVRINGVWKYLDTTWNEAYDSNWHNDYPYIFQTTNQLMKDHSWEYSDYPQTPDSPPMKPPVDTSQADSIRSEIVKNNGQLFLKILNAKNGDDIVFYSEGMKYIYYENIYLENNETVYYVNISSAFGYKYDLQGKFYVTRATEYRPESKPVLIQYDFRPKTMQIPLSNISINNNVSGYDWITIKGNFDYDGEMYLYNESGNRVDVEWISKGDKEITFYHSNIDSLGKTIYISAKINNGIESPKTAVVVPSIPQSTPITSSQITFTFDKYDGKLTVKNLISTDVVKVYNYDTKKVIAVGKGSNPILISKANSYKKVLITVTSANKTESTPYTYTIPILPKSDSITSKQIVFAYTNYNKDGKLTINVSSSEVIKIYNYDTKKYITSGKGSNPITITNINSNKKLLITRTSPYKLESATYLYSVPAIPQSTSITAKQISFTYINSNKDAKLVIKGISSSDVIKVYNASTKKYITSGKGSNSITIKNIKSYQKLLITKTSSYKRESVGYQYQIPKPPVPQTKTLTSKNVKVSKYGKNAKFTFSGVNKGTLITFYDTKTKKKLASFYNTKTNTYSLSNAYKYANISITLKENGKTEGKWYTVKVPR